MLEAILLLSLERVVVSGKRTPRGPRGALTCSLFLPRSRTYRGTDLVKYAVTKGALTMASTAWMKDKDDRAVALVIQPMLEVKSV